MTTRDAAANPLDIMEQIVTANDWAFDRRGEAEMVAEAPGRWCDYRTVFQLVREISTMHFTCAFDLKVPEKRRAGLYELLALANERLWIGHFGIEREDGMPVYRHAVLLRGAPGASAESLEDMIDIAITECERFFPAFQFCCGAVSQPPRHWTRRCWTAWGRRDRDPVPAARRLWPMGSAMLAGWRERGLGASYAVDPAPDAVRNAGPDLTVVDSLTLVPAGFAPAAVVLAGETAIRRRGAAAYARFAGSAVFLSIMAGRTIAGIQALLGGSAAIVRAMPNTPAAVRQGITVATPSALVMPGQRALCEDLLRAIGLVEWSIRRLCWTRSQRFRERSAYVFLLAELMEQAAIEQGIAPDLARILARQNRGRIGRFAGSQSESAAELRKSGD